jgi:hypothetical protein
MRQPCDEAAILAGALGAPCMKKSRPWVLAATILGSSMAFIDSTVVNVALPALQSNLRATVVDLQWVIEFYGLFRSVVRTPMVPLKLFQSASFSGANLLTLSLYAALGIFFFLFPSNLIQI